MYAVVGHDQSSGERLLMVTPSEWEAAREYGVWAHVWHLRQVRVYRVARNVFVYGNRPVVWFEHDRIQGRRRGCVRSGTMAGRLVALVSREWREHGSEVVRRLRLA